VGGTLTTLNGSNVVQGDGHTVRFTPTLNASGRARFDFTVTDGDGVSWTQRFCLVTTASGIPKNLRWKGDGTANAWDTTTSNWLKDTAAATFDVSDTVTFDDTGSNAPAVNVASAISPGAITVNASKNYTISGAGAINGTGGLIKSGTGTLTVGVSVGTSGTTQLSGGAIVLSSPGNLGSGALTVSDSVSVSSTYSDSLTLALNSNIVVPASATLALGLSKRVEVNGSLTGAGTVNVTTTSNLGTEGRAYWDAPTGSYTGALNISGGGSGRLALRLLGGSFDNFTSTKLNLSGVSIYNSNYSAGATIKIGSLSGDSTSSLKGAYNSGAGITTWQIGALNQDTTYAGTILDGTSSTKLTKEGSGSLTISGNSTYTGATTLSAGKLFVNGTLGNTAVSTASGTTLAGTGSIGSSTGGAVTIATGGILSPGSTAGAAGTLTVGNGLTFGDISLPFDLSSNPSGTNNDKIVLNGGTMTVNGVPTFTFNYLDGVLGNGTYTLISGGTETSAPTSAQPASNLPTGTRQTFSLARSGSGSGQCYIQLTVSGTAPATLTWTGANGGIWDSQTTSAWSGGPTATFYNFDAVTFNDTSSNGSVNINSSVAPRSLTVSNSTLAYTFSGTGAITGTTSLTKSGTGSLTISNANTYSGGTVINAGTIILANDTANTSGLGTGTITFNSGTLTMYDNSSSYNSQTYYLSVPAGKTGTFNTDSRSDLYGTLTGSGAFNVRLPWIRTALFADWSAFTGQLNFTTDSDGGDLRLATSYSYPGFPNASVNLADKVNVYFIGTVSQSGTTIPFGALSGGSLSTLKGGASASGGRSLTYRIGSKGTDATFAGTISEQDSTVTSTSIVKTGSGSWTLSGNSAWNGSTTVESGTLIISGSVSSSTVNIQSGAQLTLSNGNVTADAVNVSGNATLNGSGSIVGDLNNDGTITSSSGTLNVTGSVVNNGTMRFTNGSGITTSGVNTFVNNGLLDLLTGLQSLPANFENNGTVLDSKDLRVASVSKNGSNFSLTILGYTGHNYQLQRNTSLTGGTWVNVGSAQAGSEGTALSFSDSSASGAKGFYRLQVTP
jgi:autotransporter-associated beta strand protein